MSPDQEKEQERRFDRIISQLQEWFPDYFVVVRYGKGGVMWRSSDSTWASGACRRYTERMKDKDRIELEEERDGPSEQP